MKRKVTDGFNETSVHYFGSSRTDPGRPLNFHNKPPVLVISLCALSEMLVKFTQTRNGDWRDKKIGHSQVRLCMGNYADCTVEWNSKHHLLSDIRMTSKRRYPASMERWRIYSWRFCTYFDCLTLVINLLVYVWGSTYSYAVIVGQTIGLPPHSEKRCFSELNTLKLMFVLA
jgi:hypothetical protein